MWPPRAAYDRLEGYFPGWRDFEINLGYGFPHLTNACR